MKYFKYILIIAITLFLFGCEKVSSEEQYIQNYTLPSEIKPFEESALTSNPIIDSNIGATITWESSDQDVISDDGTIYFHEDDMSTTITMHFDINNITETRYFEITVKAATIDEILQIVSNNINLEPEPVQDNNKYELRYNLPTRINYSDLKIKVSWSSNKESIISNTGIFNYPEQNTDVILTGIFSYEGESLSMAYTINTSPLDTKEFDVQLSKISIPKNIDDNIELPSSINVNGFDYTVTWESNNQDVISNNGELYYVSDNTAVTLTASVLVKNIKITKEFNVTALPANGTLAIDQALKEISIPSIISNDIILPTKINGVDIEWESSNTSYISNDGKINKTIQTYQSVKLTAKCKAGDHVSTSEYDTIVSYEPHMYLDRTFEGEKIDTKIDGTKLVLADGKLSGTYTTDIIECDNFVECVGSYAATSSETEICELKVRIRINNTWTKYFTYGEFGKGLQNGYSNQTGTNSKMVEDEIKVTTGYADAFQLQLSMKRSSLNEEGPIVSLLALSLDYSDYTYSVDISNLPKEYKHDVPKLCQHDVPSIGGSICSITSSTMLMLYRGYTFEGHEALPHQYMAEILRDYGHSIYGNWSYNCIGMSSFGAITYVKRFYSYNEIINHLYYVGPISASIKGTFVTDDKTYTTNGHLIVITGYKIENNQTYFYINDPNYTGVSTRCTLEALQNVNRMVSYIIE